MSDNALKSTLILGVGNPLRGDDGVGVAVIDMLESRRDELPPHVTLMDGGTGGLGLIPLFEAYRRVILVDAIPMGCAPGTIRRIDWHEVNVRGHGRSLSLHESDLSDALVLADALECLPDELVIFGVQPQHMDWECSISPAVQQALPSLVDALILEVRSNE